MLKILYLQFDSYFSSNVGSIKREKYLSLIEDNMFKNSKYWSSNTIQTRSTDCMCVCGEH